MYDDTDGLERQFGSDGELYERPTPDAQAFITEGGVPEGSYRAPTHEFRQDNGSGPHQGGYHVHLKVLGGGRYQSTNICFTRDGDTAIAYTHNDRTSERTFTLAEMQKKRRIKNLKNDGLEDILRKDKPWTTQIPAEHVELFKIK